MLPCTILQLLFHVLNFSLSSFFFNDTATTEIYTLSLHDALPIYQLCFTGRIGWGRITPPQNHNGRPFAPVRSSPVSLFTRENLPHWLALRSEEHTSELQSQFHLVCRLLLEKKKIDQCFHAQFCNYYSTY